jgi:hypothetical protein
LSFVFVGSQLSSANPPYEAEPEPERENAHHHTECLHRWRNNREYPTDTTEENQSGPSSEAKMSKNVMPVLVVEDCSE